MSRKQVFGVMGVSALALIAGSIAIAQPGKDAKDAKGAPPEMQLPPGWTSEDMQACMQAGIPGEQHAMMSKSVGTWNGKCEMWMAPGMPGSKSECKSVVTSLMDGRFVQIDNKGEMMGQPFHGMGVNGFDNVSGKYVSTWIDNMGTGIMNGTGELSKDGKVMTWNYTYNCPLTKKPSIMREVETHSGPDAFRLEMFTNDPKSGKEYKMMQIDFTRAK